MQRVHREYNKVPVIHFSHTYNISITYNSSAYTIFHLKIFDSHSLFWIIISKAM